jgi:uncharacterized protein (TIGR00255 family)
MLRSMTGFGRGEASGVDVAVVVELRSVNHRFLDVQVRGPREYMAFEPGVQQAVKKAFRRGRIEVHVRRSPIRSLTRVRADPELFSAYVDAARSLYMAREELPDDAGIMQFALKQPGVIDVSSEEHDVLSEGDVLMTALEVAIDAMRSMRDAEGASLHGDMQRHLVSMIEQVEHVDAHVAGLKQRLRERLERRVQRLLGDRFEPWRLMQEVAILTERADVSEELTRLRSHALQFRDAMDRDEPVGRRLDFLLQEMNREINTLGSKAAEHPVSHLVVEMKAILERMREQAANVE